MSLISRPKRHCKSRSALELLSGSDVTERHVPRRKTSNGSYGLVKEVGAEDVKSTKSKAATFEVSARDDLDGSDVADAVFILKHFVDPSMLSVLTGIQITDSLERHVASGRGTTSMLKCKYCDVLHRTKADFVVHLQLHSVANYKPWCCPLCSFTAIFRSSLAVHLNAHAEKKQFTCELCHRGFDASNELVEHLVLHDKSESEICFCCGQIFGDKNLLKCHLTTDHTDIVSKMVREQDQQPMDVDDNISHTEAATETAAGTTVAITDNQCIYVNSLSVQSEASVAGHTIVETSYCHSVESSMAMRAMDGQMADSETVAAAVDSEAGDQPAIEPSAATTSPSEAALPSNVVAGGTPPCSESCLVTESGVTVSAAAEVGCHGLVVIDPQAFCETKGCDVQLGTIDRETTICETEDQRSAQMTLMAMATGSVTAYTHGCTVAAADHMVGAPILLSVASTCAGVASCERIIPDVISEVAVTPESVLSAANFVEQRNDVPTEQEIVIQVTQEGNAIVRSLPLGSAAGKSLFDGTQLSYAPVILGSRKRIDGCIDDVSLVAAMPVATTGVLSATAEVVDSGTAAVHVDVSCTAEGIDGSLSNGGRLSTNTEKIEIDDVLLEYCIFKNDSGDRQRDKPGKRPNASCKFCDFPIRSQTSFTNHLRKAHGDMDIRPYKCSVCDYRAALKGNLEQHTKFHAQDRPFTCSICGKGFIQKYKLDLHFKFHENKREFPCDQCDSAFNDQHDLNRHKKNVHFPEETAVKCPTCARLFKSQYYLDMHLHVHTGEKEYSCEVCGKQYSTRESLRSHMKGHQYQFGCEICSKTLGSYSAFIAHKRLHDPNHKGFPCDECDKSFLFRATLESHKLMAHSTERPFKCDQCPKAFKTKGQLSNHVICHQKDKPFVCDICGYSVKRRDSLKLHMYRHAPVKPYSCGHCNKEYTQKQALEIHVKTKHAGITTFNCRHCEKGFNTNYLLKKHLVKVHNLGSTALVQPAPSTPQQAVVTEESVEEVTAAAAVTNQDVHTCEYCLQTFTSQHALALHLVMDHVGQQKWLGGEGSTNPIMPTTTATSGTSEESRGISINEELDIPIAEEVLILIRSADNVLNDGGHNECTEKGKSTTIMADEFVQKADNP